MHISSPNGPRLASHVSAVTALTPLAVLGCGRGATAAGLASGACAVVERGAGRMRAWFKAHEGAVTRLLPYHEHYMVSAGADRTVALWDLRMAGSRGGNSSGAKAGSSRMLVRRLGGVSSPVADCALVGGAVACAAGSRIAVAPARLTQGGPEWLDAIIPVGRALQPAAVGARAPRAAHRHQGLPRVGLPVREASERLQR